MNERELERRRKRKKERLGTSGTIGKKEKEDEKWGTES